MRLTNLETCRHRVAANVCIAVLVIRKLYRLNAEAIPIVLREEVGNTSGKSFL